MTTELRFLAATVILGLVHLIVDSHLISFQLGYCWTASVSQDSVLTGNPGQVRGILEDWDEEGSWTYANDERDWRTWGKKGEPWHAASEGNGWGVFQRDDTGGGIPVTTNQVWNWQENVKVALQQDEQGVLGKGELQQKRDAVDRVFNDYQTRHPSKYAQQPPPDLDVEGHTLSARDVLTMETYNGAGRIRELLVFTPANPVGVGPGKRWQWVLPNAPSKPKPYVNLIMIESDSGP
jgi:hypothetical protein